MKTPQISIFDAIRLDPRYSRERSVDWYKRKVAELGGNAPDSKSALFASTKDQQSNQLLPGTMVFFGYDPKYKQTLPYYDRFPLSFIFDISGSGFKGINFHYLGYATRAKLYQKMVESARKGGNSREQVLKLNWQLLGQVSRFPEIRPAVKSYIWGHVQTKFIRVAVEDWKTAIMLPNEQFMKQNFATVARASTRKITGR